MGLMLAASEFVSKLGTKGLLLGTKRVELDDLHSAEFETDSVNSWS